MASIDERLMDKRVVDRNLEKGLVQEADVTKYLKSLQDVEDNAELIALHDEEDEDDGDGNEEPMAEEETPEFE